MTASDVRAKARERLAGKWGKAALISLVFALITYIISFVLNLVPFVGYIVSAVISVPLSYGLIISMLKLNDDNEVSCLDFFNNGFSNFGKAWSVTLQTIVRLIFPIILLIITMCILVYGDVTKNDLFCAIGAILYIVALIYLIIKQFSYRLAIFVLVDNPEMTGKDAVLKSAELMNGKIWSLFCLNLSFIGWAILSVFTLGIGMLWLAPYIRIAEINFYRNLVGEVTPQEDTNNNSVESAE